MIIAPIKIEVIKIKTEKTALEMFFHLKFLIINICESKYLGGHSKLLS